MSLLVLPICPDACNEPEFNSYSQQCADVDARPHAFYYTLCGHTTPCLTNQAEVQAACDAGWFRIVKVVKGVLSDATINEVQDDFSCVPDSSVQDYTFEYNGVIKWKGENDPFWEQINAGKYSDHGWVNREGVVFKPDAAVRLSIFTAEENEKQVYKQKATWTQKSGILKWTYGREPLFHEDCK